MTQEELRGRTDSLASSYLAQGVTFDFAGEERPFPLDAVPRVISYSEWSHVESGIKQRVRALEAFLDDERSSVTSPLGAARQGAQVGDDVVVHAPIGTWTCTVLAVEVGDGPVTGAPRRAKAVGR